MKKFDFDTPVERRNTGSIKYDEVGPNQIPMWVADMDFKTAPAITEALIQRASSGVYGYTSTSKEWADAYIGFYRDRHNFSFRKENLVFCLGVVPIISSSVRKLTQEGDNVVVLSPVYNIFYNSIINNKRKVLEVPLIRGVDAYSIDFAALEKAFADPRTTLCIFCNPHNPVGRIWNGEELGEVGKLAKEHGVIVISDEIHGELTAPGKSYVPFASVNEVNREVSLTCLSPTKAWNLAGIHTAAFVCFNEEIKAKVERQINTDEVAEPNIFSCVAAIKAYNEGREYLDELREYLFENYTYLSDFLVNNLPMLRLFKEEATYLAWVDISSLGIDDKTFCKYLLDESGVLFNDGSHYGTGGEGFIRINLACPRKTLVEGLNRFKDGVNKLLSRKEK